jgi:NDP-sugar pyrophosphorylase family protein
MLVAAGFGQRLDPLTRELPKPALPVGNRPVAWYALSHLARSGVREVVANAHHLADRLVAALEPVCPPEIALSFAHEARILGTGGGVRNAWRPQPGEDFAIMNAKYLFAPDLERALAIHRELGAIATMVLRRLPAGANFTPVHVSGEGRIRDISRQAPAGLSPHPPLMYTGVQILNERAHRDLPAEGDIIEGAYRSWFARGEIVASVIDDGPWCDIGVSLEHYLAANLALCEGSIAWPEVHPGPRATLVADSARIDPLADVERCAIGADARVDPGSCLRNSVLWPGTHARGEHENTVLTSAGMRVRIASPAAGPSSRPSSGTSRP